MCFNSHVSERCRLHALSWDVHENSWIWRLTVNPVRILRGGVKWSGNKFHYKSTSWATVYRWSPSTQFVPRCPTADLCAGCPSFKLLCLTARRGGLNPHLSSGSNRIAWSLLVNDCMMLERSEDEITKLAVFYRAPGSLRRLIGKW